MENKNKEVIEIVADNEIIEVLESLYYDYRAKQDIINSVFDLHKYDDDTLVVESAPFKAYEKAFADAKVKYDNAMLEVQNIFIPGDLQERGCKWEVNFDEKKIIVTPM